MNWIRRLESPLTEEARPWSSTFWHGGNASAFRRPCNCLVARCSSITSPTPITPSASRRVLAVTRRRWSMVDSGSSPVKHRDSRNQRATPRRVNVDTSITRTVAMDPTAASGMCMMYGRRVRRWRTAGAGALATGGEWRITDASWWLYPKHWPTSGACNSRRRKA